MADKRGLLLVAAGALVVGAVWFGTSASAKAKAAGQLKVAGDAGGARAQAGTFGSMSIKNGVTPGAWTPYCPPGAHTGPHRLKGHPKNSSPNFSRLTTDPHAYDWVFSPPSEVDL